MPTLFAASLYVLLNLFAAAFLLALAAGAPWGHLAMGGRYPGRQPAPVRVVNVLQAGILAFLAVQVGARGGLPLPTWPLAEPLRWSPVAIGALSLAANLTTPSRAERLLWAPVAAGMTLASLAVALA